ncbi:MAG: alkaline phosphatase D family protein [Opitutaceae bacterium]
MPNYPRKLSRRNFLTNSAALAAGAAVTAKFTALADAAQEQRAVEFVSNWSNCPDRVWIGPEYWSNPLQDWCVNNGRVECTHAAGDRNLHVLTRTLGEQDGNFELRVQVGRVDGTALGQGEGSVGFRIGSRGPLPDFRNALIFGRGIDAGLASNGGLFIGAITDAKAGAVKLDVTEAVLRLTGARASDGYQLTLTVLDKAGRTLGSVSKSVPAERCSGNLVLVNNFATADGGAGGGGGKAGKAAAKKGGGAPAGGLGAFWFADWRISGRKISAHPGRTFGPLLFSQYTVSAGVMKLSAQLPPLGTGDASKVRLQLKAGANWRDAGESPIHPEARTAAFRIAKWDATKEVEYRLACTLQFRDGKEEEHHWNGIIRRDPVDQAQLSVADISCNIHSAFPNAPYVASVASLNPDFLAFTGDQFYESSGGYGIIRTPVNLAMIDYLRKWYMHGWTWRELMRDRPSVSIPDDHDVYQGNLWGEGGHLNPQGQTSQESGGYTMTSDWVNVVYRTQTAHHPDPYDPTLNDGVMQYYGPLTYGRVSFAVLADRQYKSGPQGKVPPTGGPRGDHETNPNFDPKTADVAGLVLLGDKQEKFLREWVRDWRGAEMKAVISQTIFTSFPTTHGGDRQILRADYDSNGWPQTPRNRAVREMRKAFAFHIAGDQHIPGVIHYGVDTHKDGSIAFAGPALNCGYSRWWEPEKAAWTNAKQSGLTGDFTDSFGNPLTVLAVRNGGALQPRQTDVLKYLEEKTSGIGMVRFDKRQRKIRIECWPFLADPTQPGTQWEGWPIEFDLLQNYSRKIVGHLPPLTITGVKQPVIEVTDAATGELVYALRATEPGFRPHVFAAGKYNVRVSDPEAGKSAEVKNLEPREKPQKAMTVKVG